MVKSRREKAFFWFWLCLSILAVLQRTAGVPAFSEQFLKGILIPVARRCSRSGFNLYCPAGRAVIQVLGPSDPLKFPTLLEFHSVIVVRIIFVPPVRKGDPCIFGHDRSRIAEVDFDSVVRSGIDRCSVRGILIEQGHPGGTSAQEQER